MSEVITKSNIEKLIKMIKDDKIDEKSIFNLIASASKINSWDETAILLFQLLFKEQLKTNNTIIKLNKTHHEKGSCVNCGHTKFYHQVVNISVRGSSSGIMKTGQHTGDWFFDVCANCSYCNVTRPDYWS